MEKREKELRAVERRSAGQRSKETVVMEEKRYKYLPWSQRSDKSQQYHGLSVTVLHYDISAL